MRSIEEALVTAGAEEDLQTILQVLEDESVGFKRHEAAAGPWGVGGVWSGLGNRKVDCNLTPVCF